MQTAPLLTHTLDSGALCTLRHTNPGEAVPTVALTIDHRIPEGIVSTLTTSLTHTDGTPSASAEEALGLVARLDARWVGIMATPADALLRTHLAALPAEERAALVRVQDLRYVLNLCAEMVA